MVEFAFYWVTLIVAFTEKPGRQIVAKKVPFLEYINKIFLTQCTREFIRGESIIDLIITSKDVIIANLSASEDLRNRNHKLVLFTIKVSDIFIRRYDFCRAEFQAIHCSSGQFEGLAWGIHQSKYLTWKRQLPQMKLLLLCFKKDLGQLFDMESSHSSHFHFIMFLLFINFQICFKHSNILYFFIYFSRKVTFFPTQVNVLIF